MGTSKASRAAPSRTFENYTLSRITSPTSGLVPISDSVMTEVIGGSEDDTLSSILSIGFDFSFNGVTYKRVVVNSNGWMALADPTETSAAAISGYLLISSSYQNQGVNLTNATNNVLLCPWFDDLKTVGNVITNLPVSIGATKQSRISLGIESPPIVFNQIEYGVKTYLDTKSPEGRRFIVRWTCLSDYNLASNIIRFDAVLYENGKIEFRYVPRQSLTLTPSKWGTTTGDADPTVAPTLYAPDNYVEDATIGIFAPGTNKFRDFALGLGRSDVNRKSYIYGGAVYDSTFADAGYDNYDDTYISRPYVWRLVPGLHWPGSNTAGAMFVFAPPQNRRKNLPRLDQKNNDSVLRLPTVSRTGDARRGNSLITYDDRKTVIYVNAGLNGTTMTGTLVNYPTTLQRFYGGAEPGVANRQDLFTGDFEFIGSIVKSSSDNFVSSPNKEYIAPWSEDKLFENSANSVDNPFFSGSNISILGDGLSYPLRSKTHIRMALPLKYSIQMFGVSSSMYYYNRRSSNWQLPQNSVTSIGNASSSMQPNSKGDIGNPIFDGPFQRVIEDVKGFGPIGNIVSSGSIERVIQNDQTDSSIMSSYSPANVSLALGKIYNKSIQTNEEYRANLDEVFSLPINHPFIIEKAIIEIPLSMGDGWFNDRTTCMEPHDNVLGSFDFGGPGITVSLYNQYNVNGISKRDLIMSGTITHANDNTSDIVLSSFSPLSSTFQLRPVGFKAFGGYAAAVVTPSTFTQSSILYQRFTGSVPVQMTAGVSNGVVVKLTRQMNDFYNNPGATANRLGLLELFNSPKILLTDNQVTTNYVQQAKIAYINNFGRAATGFEPSGRSLYGKEFITSRKVNARGQIDNPFYIASGSGGITAANITTIMAAAGRPQFAEAYSAGSNFAAHAAISLEGHQPSPYLVYPSDTLILAISKTRPVFYGTRAGTPFTSGSIVHDVILMTGSINMTFYGSMIKEGREYHDTLNQPLASDAIHEIVVGNEPVLDQYELEYRDTFTSGSSDDYIVGAMITKTTVNSKTVFVTGSRGRIMSKNNARFAPRPGQTQNYDASDSISFQSQPYSEKAGDPRFSQMQDASERFWDSMMPSISKCVQIDGGGIFLCSNISSSFNLGNAQNIDFSSIGFLCFDYQAPTLLAGGWGTLFDGVWTWSYPFEPRYAGVARQQYVEKSYTANYRAEFDNGYTGVPYIKKIPPVPVKGFYVGPVGSEHASVPPRSNIVTSLLSASANGNHKFNFICDTYLNTTLNVFSATTPLTGAVGATDLAKVMFGFGDLNNITYSNTFFDAGNDGAGVKFGTNHFADVRNRTIDSIYNYGIKWSISPIIRGWKYGVYSGLPAFSKAYFRPGRYGQFRDILEQRLYTKFYQSNENSPQQDKFQTGVSNGVISIKFLDSTGKLTKPENTSSQNLSFEATSSVPYFDGEVRNRVPVSPNTLNKSILSISTNKFGQITL